MPWLNHIVAASTIVSFHPISLREPMSRFASALLIAILLGTGSPASASDRWLPLTKTHIVDLTVGSANVESMKVELVDEKTRAKKTKSLASDESVWLATNPTL